MGYVWNVGDKISADVLLSSVYRYTDTAFSYRGVDTTIYTMRDEFGNVLVWKTTSVMGKEIGNRFYPFKEGDKIRISGRVKELGQYKGTEQTVLTRCKAELLEMSETKEEIEERERKAQLESLKDGDFIWNMPYRQYKQHYADCETLKGSYKFDKYSGSTIKVIVRAGRMKNSGVRGEHFSGYQFQTGEGKLVCYRAVCEDNARKQMLKDFPNSENWNLVHVF